MSKSILKQLYDGDIFPAENIVPKDPDYRKLCSEAGETSDKFRKRLLPEDKELFDKITQLEERVADIHSFESFSYGFRFGIVLMTDIFLNR